METMLILDEYSCKTHLVDFINLIIEENITIDLSIEGRQFTIENGYLYSDNKQYDISDIPNDLIAAKIIKLCQF